VASQTCFLDCILPHNLGAVRVGREWAAARCNVEG